MSASYAPVVVFAYNRPDHLSRTLDALSRAEGARDTALWLFCDGPKTGQPTAPVEAVRGVAREPRWAELFASVRVVVAEHNKGLAKSIITGVSEVLRKADRVIVIEDDLLVASDFLRFVNACLEFYRDDSSVGSVTGFCPLKAAPPDYTYDVMAVPRNCSQGWATWTNRWQQVDWDVSTASDLWRDAALRRRFNAAGSDRCDRLRRQLEGRIDSWSIRFGLWQTMSGKYTIYPAHNRVLNIGYDGSGVHSRLGQATNDTMAGDPQPFKLTGVAEDEAVLRAFQEIYSGSPLRRFVRAMRINFQALMTR
ncbi:MAG: glycosyltransferase [Pseudomonadales bacterium]|nr:glycosyltransferase [Pseudomonadales bacterium]